MATKKQPDYEEGALPEEVTIWFAQFLKHLEITLIDAADHLPESATPEDYAIATLRAVTGTLMEADSSLGPNEIVHLMSRAIRSESVSTSNLAWSPELNARRFVLIDKDIHGRLSSEELFELASLTRAMRDHVESETNLPFEGAQKLHEFLMDFASPSSDEQH